MTADFELITGQLQVTKDKTTPESLGRHIRTIGGSAYLQGPVQFGNDKTFHPDEIPPFTAPIPKPEATVMIGPLKNTDSPVPLICDPLRFIPKWEVSPCGVTGIGAEKYEEKLAHPYSLVVRGGPHISKDIKCQNPTEAPVVETPSQAAAMFIGDVDIYGYTRVKDRLSVCEKADFNNDVVVNGDIITGSNITLSGTLEASGEVMSGCGGHILSVKKDFDIPHPTREGWRLTHACIEGPEAAVYIRGRVKNKNEISLPEYWKGLVDINTITVNLTSIGAHQDVIIKRWDDQKVYLQAKGGMPIDCFYYIMAERKDTEKLIPEYPGSIEDYPGDNSQRSISGYHYDVKS